MSIVETLGVLAHRGGLVVERPELSVGIVRAVCRPSGLELELLARRPLDRRSASQRQADIRAGRDGPTMAPRRLLPPFDEGIDLRVGWLDGKGRARWEFGSLSSSSGDHSQGTRGPSLRTVLHFPPLFDHVSVVLAWPEIGFPETIVDLSLPDRVTVGRDTVSIWEAPLNVERAEGSLNHRTDTLPFEDLPIEAGRIVAMPQVVNRGQNAAVVLTRLTAVGKILSMEILSVADGERADALSANAFPPAAWRGQGAAVAVVHDRDAVWVEPYEGSSQGGGHAFRSQDEYIVSRPDSGALTLMVAWPAAGLADVRVVVPLSQD